MPGIAAYGGYIPRLRLLRQAIVAANSWANPALKSQGQGERAMCNWDEDAVTMAVEAARDCLGAREREGFAALVFASTSAPFDDRQNAGIVAQALRLAGTIATMDVAASQRAGTSALIAAFDTAASRGPVLFVAAEKRAAPAGGVQELQMGDGAAALILQSGDGIARLLGRNSASVDFVDHYRGHGSEFDYAWEERWIRDEGYLKIVPPVIASLLAETGTAAGAITHFCLPCTLPRVAQTIAKQLGVAEGAVRDNLAAGCGDTGTAHAIVMLVHALEQAKKGDRILVAGFGQGCDALLFEVTGAPTTKPRGIAGSLAAGRSETNYAKYLAFNDLVKIEKGLRAEVDKQTPLSTLYRKRAMLLALVGGRCECCGTVQFPKSKICVNPNCGARHAQVDQPFAEFAGKIMSYTADNLTYTPDPPAHYGMVQFAEGGRMMADFTDVDPGAVETGMAMRMVFRIKEFDTQRNFPRYFWKAAPVQTGRAAKES
ncbi:MAG TPA: OB-fold domain-containing protein [Stellaceae bacterium]|nr:OB-fold domain-containing protein [Stellaceae bacterium]